ncbi:dTMP kinase [bacterium]|nr:dTMP kinase [bacterium]
MAKQGFFISFEGGEGGGKSTQIRRLTSVLRKNKIPFVVTLEPGGTAIGKKIRELLLNPKNKKLSQRAELYLYEADRAQHVEEVVKPALEAGKVVITDRYADSSTVYQGICRGLGVSWTEKLNDFATGGIYPDLVIVLDIPETIGLARVKARLSSDPKLHGKRRVVKMDRLEREKQSFHRKVRKGFIALSKKHPKRITLLDATQAPDEVSRQILEEIGKRWRRKLL